VNFIIDADVCCIPPPERDCGVKAGEDWVTAGHDFRRTNASNNSTGDAQCKQTLAWSAYDASGFVYNHPTIYDGVLLAGWNTKLVAYDINVGAPPLWTKTGLPYIGSGFRNSVTAQDGYVYFGGGSGRSMTKADVYTGAVAWSRNVTASPLTGNTVYTTSVIMDCGGTPVLIFGTTAGMLYALDANTGLNYAGWAVNPLPLDGDVWFTVSPTAWMSSTSVLTVSSVTPRALCTPSTPAPAPSIGRSIIPTCMVTS